VLSRVEKPLGIHTHNDSELAVANSLTAVQAGALMVAPSTVGASAVATRTSCRSFRP
jgi:isopropylmalate/homocitrate/citramalate synthase